MNIGDVVKFKDKYVEILSEESTHITVRLWEHDEQYNLFPTQRIYSIPKEDFVDA